MPHLLHISLNAEICALSLDADNAHIDQELPHMSSYHIKHVKHSFGVLQHLSPIAAC